MTHNSPSEKFVLELTIVLIAGMVFLAAFWGIDRYYERNVKVKLAELGFEYKKEIKQ